MRWTGTAMTNRTGAIIVAAALLCSSQALAQSSGGNGVSNFLGGIFSGQKNATSPQPQAAPGPDGAPPPWSGEDGASGHPLMAATAIRQAAANFPNCVAGMWPDAARRGITQANFERFTAGLAPGLWVLGPMGLQPRIPQ